MTAKAQVRRGILRGPGQLTLHPAHSPNLYERSEPMSERTCSADGCAQPHEARGWCNVHYLRWYRNGDPLKGGPLKTQPGEASAFLDAVLRGDAPREPNGCIRWPHALKGKGYAHVGGEAVGRLVLEHFVGPAPTPRHTMGHAAHDVCGSRRCVAPEHLSWQTYQEQTDQQRKDGTYTPPQSALGQAHHSATVDDETVRAAVARVRAGETRKAVAADLGVNVSTVKRWVSGHTRRSSMGVPDA